MVEGLDDNPDKLGVVEGAELFLKKLRTGPAADNTPSDYQANPDEVDRLSRDLQEIFKELSPKSGELISALMNHADIFLPSRLDWIGNNGGPEYFLSSSNWVFQVYGAAGLLDHFSNLTRYNGYIASDSDITSIGQAFKEAGKARMRESGGYDGEKGVDLFHIGNNIPILFEIKKRLADVM